MKDGLYLMYVKDKTLYSVVMSNDQWELLQMVARSVTDDPIRVIENPLANVTTYGSDELNG